MPRQRPQIVLSAEALPDQMGLFRGVRRWLDRDPSLCVRCYPPLNATQVRGLPCGGLITDTGAEMRKLLRKARFPIVSVTDHSNPQDGYFVAFDEQAIGRMAADHFLDQGYWQFACVIYGTSSYWGSQRERGFAERLGEAGRSYTPLHVEDLPRDLRSPHVMAHHDAVRQRAIGALLKPLPKPLAVFAGDDLLALMVADACERAGLSIPADVALLGVNNSSFCELSAPRLSSIAVPSERVGYEAMAMVSALLREAGNVRRRTLLPPLGVMVRPSSDALQVRDPVVAKALHYIRDHPREAVSVKELAAHVAVSRRTLELRFRQAVGRTPGEEVLRLRTASWRRLLADTDLSMAEIAQHCGFSTPATFATAVRRTEGVAPTTYRRTAQGAKASGATQD